MWRDHPTSRCPPKTKAQNQVPQGNKWCECEKKWMKHETQKCYYCIRYLRELGIQQNARPSLQLAYQKGVNQNFKAQGTECMQLALQKQPPLPRAVRVRYMYSE